MTSPLSRESIPRMELPSPITVVLADDQRAYRDGLARAIESHARLELVAVARDGDEAFEAIETLGPDVALVDVRMPGRQGTEVCADLRRQHSELRTCLLLMSAHGGDTMAGQVEEAGADGFISKDLSRRQICEALVRAAQHDRAGEALAFSRL